MDTAQWPQGIGVVKTVVNSRPTNNPEKKPRPQKEQAINCPRCSSTNTKFCYYNNYSLTQPRYFCKTCRRYWTEGGSLRSVPVGGGSRKNKRPSSNNNSSTTLSSKKINTTAPDSINLSPPNFSTHQNPKIHQGQDLNLAYNPPNYNGLPEFVALPFAAVGSKDAVINPRNPNSQVEFFKNGSMSSFMSNVVSPVAHDGNSVYGFSNLLHEFKPSLGFSVDGLENGYGSLQTGVNVDVDVDVDQDHHTNGTTSSSSRLLFPFEELKPVANNIGEFDQERGQGETNGFWNGMLAGGSW